MTQTKNIPQAAALHARVLNAVFISFVQFTGGGGFAPVTGLGKLLLVSYSFVVMLFVASYTANLAAFLVSHPSSVTCPSLEDFAS